MSDSHQADVELNFIKYFGTFLDVDGNLVIDSTEYDKVKIVVVSDKPEPIDIEAVLIVHDGNLPDDKNC